jgi:hypothetical protein
MTIRRPQPSPSAEKATEYPSQRREIPTENGGPSTLRMQNQCRCKGSDGGNQMVSIDPLTATAVVIATAATDAVYVMFTAAVVARRRVPAASWSSIWYLLSSYAVISYTENWVYVAFAAAGSWIGAFASISFLHRPPGGPPVGAGPE